MTREISERLSGLMLVLGMYVINIIMVLNTQAMQPTCVGLAYFSKCELYHPRSLFAF